jgi:hypothetical protein
MENTDTHDHDHGHEEAHETVEVVSTVTDSTPVAEVVHEGHAHSGMDGLLEVMFGFEHVVAEFFWNGVFILTTFLITKAFALRKIHKYVDDKHGVKHKKEEY